MRTAALTAKRVPAILPWMSASRLSFRGRLATVSVLAVGMYAACSNAPKGEIENEAGGNGGTPSSGGASTTGGTGGTGLTSSGGSANSSSGGTGGATGGSGGATGGSGGNVTTGGTGGATGGTGGATGGVGGASGAGGSLPGGMGGTAVMNDPTCMAYPEQNARKVVIKTDLPDSTNRFSQMSQSEKLAIMSGVGPNGCPSYNCFDALGVPARNIPDFRMRDGPRGVRSVEANPEKSTAVAVSEARAASFDLDLEYRVGKLMAAELRALRSDILLAPTINILRHPRWARAQETYGEDPVLQGEMGTAFVLGHQQDGAGMPACPKHFAGNNTDENRGGGNTPGAVDARVDERTLRENYTRAFQMIVERADPASIMAAYNKVNGTLCTENTHLLTDILRTDWGWKGFVVSDWWATGDGPGAGRGPASVNAGLDCEMPTSEAFSGLTSSNLDAINQASKRILDVRASFGQLSDAYIQQRMGAHDTNIVNTGMVDGKSHADIALETGEKGAVLLKNDGILPLGKTVMNGDTMIGTAAVTSIHVLGPDASKPTLDTSSGAHGLGDRGSSNNAPPHAISYTQGLMTGATGVTVTSSNNVADVAGKSIVVIPVTMGHEDEGEAYSNGGDRDNLTISGPHPSHWTTKPAALINAAAAMNPNIIVLLAVGGAVIDSDNWMSKARAIVQPFYPGQEGGTAVANLLLGKINFSAKLPFTVAKAEADYGTFGNNVSSVTFDYLHGYRRITDPLFFFGFGMSYTSYAYSDLRVLCGEGVSQQGRVIAEVTVANTGGMAGDEIVQLYVGYPASGRTPPPPARELKAFARVHLEPGESKVVQLTVNAKDLRHWGATNWEFDTGEHTVFVGPSSNPATLLSAPFTLN
jgi:beta-glucosidase